MRSIGKVLIASSIGKVLIAMKTRSTEILYSSHCVTKYNMQSHHVTVTTSSSCICPLWQKHHTICTVVSYICLHHIVPIRCESFNSKKGIHWIRHVLFGVFQSSCAVLLKVFSHPEQTTNIQTQSLQTMINNDSSFSLPKPMAVTLAESSDKIVWRLINSQKDLPCFQWSTKFQWKCLTTTNLQHHTT